MGKRHSDTDVFSMAGELLRELPEPFRSIAALWVLFTLFFSGANGAITLLKSAKLPLPWPLNWVDAVQSFNWAGFGLAVMVIGTVGAIGWVVWWRWGPGSMERRKEARLRLATKLKGSHRT